MPGHRGWSTRTGHAASAPSGFQNKTASTHGSYLPLSLFLITSLLATLSRTSVGERKRSIVRELTDPGLMTANFLTQQVVKAESVYFGYISGIWRPVGSQIARSSIVTSASLCKHNSSMSDVTKCGRPDTSSK